MAPRTKKIGKVTIRHAQEALAILFPTVKCTVAPNGVPEIWVKDDAGYGFALTLSSGKAGMSATIRKFTGSNPLTVTGNTAGDMAVLPQVDMFEVSTTVYRNDAYSQQFKRWYGATEAQRDDSAYKHPSELGMTEGQ